MKTQEIADLLDAELVGDGIVEIYDVASLEAAESGQASFVSKTGVPVETNASCLIVPTDFEGEVAAAVIRIDDPKLAFARIAEILHPPKVRDSEIHETAVIAESTSVGKGVFIGAYVCIGENTVVGDRTQIRAGVKIGDNVKIGADCVLDPGVFVEDGCTIGDRVILHSGVVIGTDGFGFVRDKTRYVKFPQIGSVVIGNDVEIGANSCVDRGALGETIIGDGTKIDNLVQIAHNVEIGKRVVIASQTGISGSTVIEDDCVIGGQVGMGDHARIKSGAVIGSQAGVLPGKIVRPGVWWGTPVQTLEEFKRQNAHIKGLERLKEEIKSLKTRIEELETDE